jgi:NADH:ubiquinone oxidoreductase subunit 2 (subunit N)
MIAFGYYGNVLREIWMRPVPDGDTTPIRVQPSLIVALGITGIATLVFGVLPSFVLHFGDLASLTSAIGG